jgi:predicted nucleic acid-binding protein
MPEKLPKILVVDASILFSFFKKDSDRRRLIEELPNFGCQLIAPKFVLEELVKEKERIKKFGHINNLAFAFLLSLLDKRVETFPEEAYKEFLAMANKISPHGKPVVKDGPYFALAFAFNSPIWSDEEAFRQQSKIKIFSTKDLIELLALQQLKGNRSSPSSTLA